MNPAATTLACMDRREVRRRLRVPAPGTPDWTAAELPEDMIRRVMIEFWWPHQQAIASPGTDLDGFSVENSSRMPVPYGIPMELHNPATGERLLRATTPDGRFCGAGAPTADKLPGALEFIREQVNGSYDIDDPSLWLHLHLSDGAIELVHAPPRCRVTLRHFAPYPGQAGGRWRTWDLRPGQAVMLPWPSDTPNTPSAP